MTTQLGTLLISCPDQKGIVAAVAQTLFGLGANIIDSDQHTDRVTSMFFQRIRFELDIDRASLEGVLRALAPRFSLAWTLTLGKVVPRVALFCSKQEHCLYDLLIRYRAGELPCEIAVVI